MTQSSGKMTTMTVGMTIVMTSYFHQVLSKTTMLVVGVTILLGLKWPTIVTQVVVKQQQWQLLWPITNKVVLTYNLQNNLVMMGNITMSPQHIEQIPQTDKRMHKNSSNN